MLVKIQANIYKQEARYPGLVLTKTLRNFFYFKNYYYLADYRFQTSASEGYCLTLESNRVSQNLIRLCLPNDTMFLSSDNFLILLHCSCFFMKSNYCCHLLHYCIYFLQINLLNPIIKYNLLNTRREQYIFFQ